MQFSAALVLVGVAIYSTLAVADMPPPRDEYAGPTNVSLAGLQFVRERIRHFVPAGAPLEQQHPGGYQTYVFLNDCAAAHPNCRVAKATKVIGWAVIAVNGTWVSGDLGAFQTAFQAAPPGQKVKLMLEREDDATPTPPRLDISFDPR